MKRPNLNVDMTSAIGTTWRAEHVETMPTYVGNRGAHEQLWMQGYFWLQGFQWNVGYVSRSGTTINRNHRVLPHARFGGEAAGSVEVVHKANRSTGQ